MAIVTLLLTHGRIKEIKKMVVVVGVTKINFGCSRGGAAFLVILLCGFNKSEFFFINFFFKVKGHLVDWFPISL